MFKWFKQFKEYKERKTKKESDKPYIEIISEGIDSVGRLKIEFDWNTAFIMDCRRNGFNGSSEEEIIQKWFQAITADNMAKILDEDDINAAKAAINSESHPDLSR